MFQSNMQNSCLKHWLSGPGKNDSKVILNIYRVMVIFIKLAMDVCLSGLNPH